MNGDGTITLGTDVLSNMSLDNPLAFDSVIMFYPSTVAATYIYVIAADVGRLDVTNRGAAGATINGIDIQPTHLDWAGGINSPNNYYWTLIGVGAEDDYRGVLPGVGAIGPNATGPFVFDRSEVPYSALQPVPVVCAAFLPLEALLTSGAQATLAASGGWFTIDVIPLVNASAIGLSPQNRDVAVVLDDGTASNVDTTRHSRGAYLFKIESANLTLGATRPFTIRPLNTYPISTSRF